MFPTYWVYHDNLFFFIRLDSLGKLRAFQVNTIPQLLQSLDACFTPHDLS